MKVSEVRVTGFMHNSTLGTFYSYRGAVNGTLWFLQNRVQVRLGKLTRFMRGQDLQKGSRACILFCVEFTSGSNC